MGYFSWTRLLFIFLITTNIKWINATVCQQSDLPEGCHCATESNTDDLIACVGLKTGKFPVLPAGMKYISFDSCQFSEIGGANVPNYLSAVMLSVSNSGVKTLQDDAFKNMMSLKMLDLSGNVIQNISKEVFVDTPVLSQLILNHNRLNIMTGSMFEHLKNLKQLHLQSNGLRHLDKDIFSSMHTQLQNLDISANNFTEIPDAAKTLTSLTTLNIAQNPIVNLKDNAFDGMTSLSTVYLSNCSLQHIGDNSFTGLSNLATVYLDHNNLEHLSTRTMSPIKDKLKHLWLNNNKLTSLQEGTLSTGGNLEELKLAKNPWHCGENMVWLKDLPLEKIDHENITCTTPAKFEGVPFANVTKAMLVEKGNKQKTMIAAAIALPIIAICVLLIIFIIYKIIQNRRQSKRANFRYSAVYRDTVESAHPPKQRPVSEI